jgi:tetracycline 7-halogenase / FADH2 O2-dependent halogenase
MIRESVDVLVIGAGFAGSLTALLLQRIGRSVVLVDRGRHPRFAIGESSTPLADLALQSLAEEYDLPQFLPLCKYGTWKQQRPELTCGQKRGFSYFLHTPGEPFRSDEEHSRELLVTASRSTEHSDTHWLRSDVDAFFARQAAVHGVPLFEGVELQPVGRDPWRWVGTSDGEPIEIEARFVVDASGPAGVVPRAISGIGRQQAFQTCSCSIYAHVEGLEPWHHVLQRIGVEDADYPFRADAAAVHHLLEEGWMWQLPFDNGVTSVGLVLDGEAPADSPEHVWQRIIQRYPTLAEQLSDARIVAPADRLVATPRLQRRWKTTAGSDWAMLPATAGFIDPLHSTGIAHSLSGVERLVGVINELWEESGFGAGLERYAAELEREFELVDHLVAACYATRTDFEVFTAATMLYFVAAITCEERRLAGERPGFLASDDDRLRERLLESARRLIALRNQTIADPGSLVGEIRDAIALWNSAGLLAPEVPNMYHYTGY